jgi:hypothetical protein
MAMSHNLHLVISKRHEGATWGDPTASIYVNPVHVDAQGYNLICPECHDIDELQAEVERLKGELDHVLEKAREELQLA